MEECGEWETVRGHTKQGEIHRILTGLNLSFNIQMGNPGGHTNIYKFLIKRSLYFFAKRRKHSKVPHL